MQDKTERAGFCELHEVDGGLDGLQVDVTGTAGDEDEVRDFAGDKGRGLGMRRGVDDGVIGPMLGGGCQNLGQNGCLCGDDDRPFFSPAVKPSFRAGLRVEVNDDDMLPCSLGSAREVDRKGCFARAPRLGKNGNCFHDYSLFKKLWLHNIV